jgi:hypothetical protein
VGTLRLNGGLICVPILIDAVFCRSMRVVVVYVVCIKVQCNKLYQKLLKRLRTMSFLCFFYRCFAYCGESCVCTSELTKSVLPSNHLVQVISLFLNILSSNLECMSSSEIGLYFCTRCCEVCGFGMNIRFARFCVSGK